MNGESYGSEAAWSFPTPRTLDYGSSAYSEEGAWTAVSGGYSGGYGTAAGEAFGDAEWTTSISSSDQGWLGGTEVSATWVANPANATNATYSIFDGSAQSGTLLGTVTVNQTQAPVGINDGNTQFQELGVFYPTSGTLTVVLDSGSANGKVVADAVGIAPSWATAGGASQYESEPWYQLSVQDTGKRTIPDVSFDGSATSGVTCFRNGNASYDYYGTSLSSPCWAGLIAIADQGRVEEGASVFNSTADPMQTLQAIYSLPESDFNQVTSGYNGLSASAGYDELTGRGSPIANLLVPDLVSYDFSTTKLAITTEPPASVTAGADFGLTVSVENESGTVLTSFDGTVEIGLSSNPGTGRLGGTLTMSFTSGKATFSNLTLDIAGTGYTIEAITSGPIGGISDPFDVNPALAEELVILTQPSAAATAGLSFGTQPVIEELDQYGNVETNDDTTVVTASLASGAGPLEGTNMATLSSGVATFTNLADDTAETITLVFKTSSLSSVASGTITVSPATPYQLVIQTQPSSSATAGQSAGHATGHQGRGRVWQSRDRR